MISTLLTIRGQSYVRRDRLDALGFCARGGNVFDVAVNGDYLDAAAVFYGTPPTSEKVTNLRAPVVGIYAEFDRGLTGRVPALLTALDDREKPYELHIYQAAITRSITTRGRGTTRPPRAIRGRRPSLSLTTN